MHGMTRNVRRSACAMSDYSTLLNSRDRLKHYEMGILVMSCGGKGRQLHLCNSAGLILFHAESSQK